MRWPWGRKKAEVAPPSEDITEPREAILTPRVFDYALPPGLRQGMWVTRLGQPPVGILIGIPEPGQALVAIVDGEGKEVGRGLISIPELFQARWEQIPPSRRGITPEQARAKGYI